MKTLKIQFSQKQLPLQFGALPFLNCQTMYFMGVYTSDASRMKKVEHRASTGIPQIWKVESSTSIPSIFPIWNISSIEHEISSIEHAILWSYEKILRTDYKMDTKENIAFIWTFLLWYH